MGGTKTSLFGRSACPIRGAAMAGRLAPAALSRSRLRMPIPSLSRHRRGGNSCADRAGFVIIAIISIENRSSRLLQTDAHRCVFFLVCISELYSEESYAYEHSEVDPPHNWGPPQGLPSLA